MWLSDIIDIIVELNQFSWSISMWLSDIIDIIVELDNSVGVYLCGYQI